MSTLVLPRPCRHRGTMTAFLTVLVLLVVSGWVSGFAVPAKGPSSMHLSVMANVEWSSEPPTRPTAPTTTTTTTEASDVVDENDFPELGDDGVYHILNRQQYRNFLQAHPDKLIVLKIFAPWCRACKGLEPKFLSIVHNDLYQDLPIVFCDLTIQHNKQFVKELGVLALPSIHFYVGTQLNDNFPCGPSKFPILKRKLTQLINTHVDANTRQLKEQSLLASTTAMEEETLAQAQSAVSQVSSSPVTEPSQAPQQQQGSSLGGEYDMPNGKVVTESQPNEALPYNTIPRPNNNNVSPLTLVDQTATGNAITEAEKQEWISKIPYFQELSLADIDQIMGKAKLLQFDAGSILMREGKHGRTFYVLLSGEVEICQQTFSMSDPLITGGGFGGNSGYLGTVINRLGPGDYFGERALITGEPRAASIRAVEPVTCWAFDKDDFPASSVLSGRTRNTLEELDFVNDKYGVDFDDLYQKEVMQQVIDASTASQVRGSINTPQVIPGVDTDDDVLDDYYDESNLINEQGYGVSQQATATPALSQGRTEEVVSLLTRFQMIRQVNQCLNYIVQTRASWDDVGVRNRRTLLVNRLPPSQLAQFLDTFRLIDTSGDGTISLFELKRVMELIGETKSDEELVEMMTSSGGHKADNVDDKSFILTQQDFLGIMAESEFYHLFRDIFASLDTHHTGFVRAKDLDRVLCGVRDLISDDRYSIIDVEDDEMLIDYEQFSRMLLGSSLV